MLARTLASAAALCIVSAALTTASGATPAARAGTATPNPCPKTGARVLVTAAGAVRLNGGAVSVDSLAAALNSLVPRPTQVCYFRERPAGEPPAAVRSVVSAIISTRLPISFYSDASFSSRVGMPAR